MKSLRTALILTVIGVLALGVTTALAGSGVGGVFNLGVSNTVDATSSLTGTVNGNSQLNVRNVSTAANSFGVLAYMNSGSAAGSSAALRSVNLGSGYGAYATSATGTGVLGKHGDSTGTGPGVEGDSASASAAGVLGSNTAGGPGLRAMVDPGVPPLQVNTNAKVANLNADLLDGRESAVFYQLRLQRATKQVTTLDDSLGGLDPSATIGGDGLGLISFYDPSDSALKVSHCSNLACSSMTTTTIDSAGDQGGTTSIAIGADGLGLISYVGAASGVANLKVAHCSNIACTSATKATIDSSGTVSNLGTSIDIGIDGLGLITYSNAGTGTLRAAHCTNTVCSSATSAAIDTIGTPSSLAIGADAEGVISYFNGMGNLRVAHCGNIACTSSVKTTVDSTVGSVGQTSSVVIGDDGLPLISYNLMTTTFIKVAHCADLFCSSATKTPIASGPGPFPSSVTIGPDGRGLVAYSTSAGGGNLKVAHCADVACSGVTTFTVDGSGNVTGPIGLTIGADGLGLIGYPVNSVGVKALHCGSMFCTPYFRRR